MAGGRRQEAGGRRHGMAWHGSQPGQLAAAGYLAHQKVALASLVGTLHQLRCTAGCAARAEWVSAVAVQLLPSAVVITN